MILQTNISNVSKSTLFEVLSNYDNYADWMPDVAQSGVLMQEGDVVIAEFDCPLLMKGKYQAEFIHFPPNSIQYRQIGVYDKSDDFNWGLSGSWQLSDWPQGSGVSVVAEMRLRTGIWNYFSNSKVVKKVMQRRIELLNTFFLPNQKTTFLEGVAGLSELGLSPKVIRRIASEQPTVVWFDGERYVVKEVAQR